VSHVLEGEQPYERFGSAIALQDGLLAVGSPSFR
jgi:hypothetical protein